MSVRLTQVRRLAPQSAGPSGLDVLGVRRGRPSGRPYLMWPLPGHARHEYLVLDTTKEALQTAPGYTYDRTKNVWLPATKQGAIGLGVTKQLSMGRPRPASFTCAHANGCL